MSGLSAPDSEMVPQPPDRLEYRQNPELDHSQGEPDYPEEPREDVHDLLMGFVILNAGALIALIPGSTKESAQRLGSERPQ